MLATMDMSNFSSFLSSRAMHVSRMIQIATHPHTYNPYSRFNIML